ncbi:aminoglycoside phosphotransferase family protein [Deinococcus aerophilus]|uniref:Aminoglycoside phosphotransferase n=1 Tax=Deinococcus aerophilus TaxID=522488 RepID=A0ABQ2GTK0_9DEIO|nr:aminoglycoside phosphotransferase family protein [Deinococcus aerophilus]GGM12687.1 aminoglycoside phosphotransferase [Deinococcus aerophilus]
MSFASRLLMPEVLGPMLGFSVQHVREGQTFTGHADRIVRLHLGDGVPSGGPRTLIAKIYGPDWYAAGLPELGFYRDLLPRTPGLPVPRLLGFVDDTAARQCTLLLEDLGGTHHPVSFPPSAAVLDRMADLLAAVHAAWWDAPALQAPAFQMPDLDVTRMPQVLDAAGLAAHAQAARQAAASFLKRHELTASERALLRRVAARWPSVFKTRVDLGQLTMIHGDLHLMGNVLQSAGGAELRLIDWATVKRGLGPHDLMFMLIPADVPEAERLERDTALIVRYHAGLCAAGLSGYPLEQCLYDHRLSLLTNLLQAVLQGSVRWFRRTAALVELWRSADLLEA